MVVARLGMALTTERHALWLALYSQVACWHQHPAGGEAADPSQLRRALARRSATISAGHINMAVTRPSPSGAGAEMAAALAGKTIVDSDMVVSTLIRLAGPNHGPA